MAAGVPIGYDSRADFGNGITSAMRAAENPSRISVSKVVASNNENLYKLMRSEPSHINQINSATPDFNTVMKNYGTFSDKTWKATVAAEKSRVDAFTSMPDDTSQTQLTGFDAKTKLKRDKTAKNQAVIEERLGKYNFNNALFRDGIETGIEVGENQTKPVVEETGSLVLNEDTGIQTTASGQHLDAIGREINQITDFVGQETYIGKNTDDVEFAAIEAVVEDVALTEALDAAAHEAELAAERTKDAALAAEFAANMKEIRFNEAKEEGIRNADKLYQQMTDDNLAEEKEIEEEIEKFEKELASQLQKDERNRTEATELAAKVAAVKKREEAVEAKIKAEEQRDRFEEILDRQDDELKSGDAQGKRNFDKMNLDAYNKQKEAEKLATATAKREEIKIENEIEAFEEELAAEQKAVKIAEDKAVQLARINNQLDPIIKPIIELEGVNVDGQGYSVGVNQTDEGKGIQQGTAITDTAKFEEIQKRIERERNGGEEKARQAQLQKERMTEELNRTENERRGTGFDTSGDAEGQRFANLPKDSGNIGEDIKKRKDDELNKSNAESSTLGEQAADEIKRLSVAETLKSNANTLPLGFNALEQKKKAQIMKTARENAEKTFTRTVNESENAFQSDDNQQREYFKLQGHNDPFAFSTFAYPPGVTNSRENGHYVLFYVNVQNKTKYHYQGGYDDSISVGDVYQSVETEETDGPRNMSITTYNEKTSASADGFSSPVAYKKQQILNGAKGSVLNNNQIFLSKNRKAFIPGVSQVFGATTTRITDSVALYLPPGVKSNLDAQYDDSKTGMFGFLAFSGKDLLNAMNDHDFDAATNEAFKTTGTILEEAGKKMAASVVSAVTGAEGVQATFDKAFGRTLNPYIEVTFGSMGMRTFDYTFKFSPKSEYETQEAKAIIQLFRFHMAPELIAGQETHNRYLTLPSTFDIHYMYQSGVGDDAMSKENDFYNKIATCVLTSVNVDYTPNNEIQSFADGAPVQISLALSFKETEMMTKDKINQGF